MNSNKLIKKDNQFLYLGRWVDKEYFTAFVYDKNGNEKLAQSYKQFEDLISSGIWYASKPEKDVKEMDAPKESRRVKNGISNTDIK